MIKPKDSELKILPREVYDKLPLKRVCGKSLRYLARNHPHELIKLANSDKLPSSSLLEVVDHLGFIEDSEIVFQTLKKFTTHPFPAIRMAAICSLSCYGTEDSFNCVLSVSKTELNENVKNMAIDLLEEINDNMS